MPEAKRRIDARGSAASLLIYLALAIGFLGRGLFGHFTDRFFGQSTDPSFYLWYFRWWPYAIGHHLNPFFTRLVYAPDGVSLAWSTLIPLPSLIAAPLQHFVGPYAALSMLCLIQPPLAAFSAYLLCRRITGSFWPSLLGGFIFGFSAYMLGQVVAHLPHAITFPLPLAVLLALELFDGTISSRDSRRCSRFCWSWSSCVPSNWPRWRRFSERSRLSSRSHCSAARIARAWGP